MINLKERLEILLKIIKNVEFISNLEIINLLAKEIKKIFYKLKTLNLYGKLIKLKKEDLILNGVFNKSLKNKKTIKSHLLIFYKRLISLVKFLLKIIWNFFLNSLKKMKKKMFLRLLTLMSRLKLSYKNQLFKSIKKGIKLLKNDKDLI